MLKTQKRENGEPGKGRSRESRNGDRENRGKGITQSRKDAKLKTEIMKSKGSDY